MNYFDILLAKKLNGGSDITVESLSVTENGTYTAPQGKAYSPVTVEVEPPEDSYQLKSITTPTSLATFEASAMPMPTLKVSVEAKQDLHGYDKPWVGGAGKNKAESVIDNWSNKGITATRNDDGSYSITGTATESVTSSFLINVYPVSEGEQYIVTNKKNQSDTASKYSRCVCSFYNDTTYKSEINVSEGQTITVPSNVNRLRLSYIWNNGFVVPAGAIFYPMIRLASVSDATFAPYSNICPITGWDAVVVSDVDDVDNPTVTQTTTITLPQTVYGGEVDVVNGVLRITKILYSKTSVSYYGLYGDENAPLFYFDISDNIKGYWDITCDSNNKLDSNYYNAISTINGSGMKDCEIRTQQATPPAKIYFRDDRFTDETSINTWLASNPLQVLCVLATPITIPLTPTLIKSLNGQNNLSVDCGDVIEGEYFIEL